MSPVETWGKVAPYSRIAVCSFRYCFQGACLSVTRLETKICCSTFVSVILPISCFLKNRISMVSGAFLAKMRQKTLGSVVGLLCTGTCLAQVSRAERFGCGDLCNSSSGLTAGRRPSIVHCFCFRHKRNRARNSNG